MNQCPAKIGNQINRVTTVLSLVLVVCCFFLRSEKGTVRLVLFLLWITFTFFSTFKMVSELVGGQHIRERRFITMLDRWQEEQGSRGRALVAFTALTALSSLIKLGVPTLLLLV